MKRRIIILHILILCGILTSCIPPICCPPRHSATFRNCTNDTLFIGASHYDNIDSVEWLVQPAYFPSAGDIDTVNVSLWKGEFATGDSFVYPDSACTIDADYLFHNTDTCYFFLVRWRDAKIYSWDEIRRKNLFKKWIVTKDGAGEINRNIR